MFKARRDERVLQLFRFLNHFLDLKKDTAKRFLQFTVPKVVGVSPQMRLVEDEPSSMSLSQICFERCTDHQIDDDTPIARYYERTAHLYPSPINHGLQETLADISRTLVPRTVLKEWALTSYSNATHYWTFRKQFTLHASLLALSEFVLHLTKLNPDMLQIIRESGFLSVFYFKFGIDDSTGELDANRAVPFRLTPNFVEFISEIGLSGVFAASMIAVARCFVEPRFAFDSYLRAVLRDEMIAWDKRKRDDVSTCYLTPAAEMDKESLVSSVDKAVNVIMTRLKNLSQLEGGEGKVTNLIAVASNPENLARMDPSWHPWL